MVLPYNAPQGFPDDTGADIFAREYPTAVAPADREYLSTRPPLFILRVPGEGEEYDNRVRRIVESLRQPLDERGKLAPYAVTENGAGDGLLADEAGQKLEFGIPRHMTPDRLPQFDLMRDVIADVMDRAAGGAGVGGARALRDRTYAQRVQRGGVPAALWRLGGGDGPPASGVYGWLLGVVWVPLTQTFFRWHWAHRKTRQLIRPARLSPFRRPRWLGVELNAERGREGFFRVMDALAQRQLPRLTLPEGHPQREESLRGLENLLVRALLEDLRGPAPGRFAPRRRRRTARPVLLVKLPPPGTPQAVRPERFLRAFHRARSMAQPPGPLVIAVGRPSLELLRQLGEPTESTLTQAGLQLNQKDGSPVLVTFHDEPFFRNGLPIGRVEPKLFMFSWQAMTSLLTGGAVLAAAVLGLWVTRLVVGPQAHPCVGGDDTVAASSQNEPVRVRPEEWYDAAYQAIQSENKRAEHFAELGRTVRTVVAFGASKPTDETDTLFDGTIPELRGIALWQQKLNDDAVSDDSRVPLRVEVRTTGKGFKDAVKKARELVDEVEHDKTRQGTREIIGVLGFAQSKDETRDALKVLAAARIPAVGTTATADEMLSSVSYWPSTPANSTEARIEADFARVSDIVERRDSEAGCTPAKHAIVIQSPADLYSRSLADKFLDDFPEKKQPQQRLISFSQQGDFRHSPADIPKYSSASDLADAVCARLAADPDSIVYWSARARDFTAFINALDTQGTCIHHDLTVLGGNELTNVAQTGAFSDKHWLRLYYSSHRLPVTDNRASDKTTQFVHAYDRFVERTTQGTDPWRQDGHSAVAYDAFHVLSRAADITYRDKYADRSAVLTALSSGISFDGATGFVDYGANVNAPPIDKTLVLLRQTDGGPVAVAACGAYRQGRSSAQQGAPCAP